MYSSILTYYKVRAFNVVSWYDFKDQWFKKIREEIQSKSKDYILRVDEEEFAQYIRSKYELVPIVIHIESEFIPQPRKTKEWVEHRRGREKYEREVYSCTVRYNYSGSSVLFTVQPNPWTMTSYEITVSDSSQTVSFDFNIYNQNSEEFHKTKNECFGMAFTNLKNINKNIDEINNGLEDIIKSSIQNEKRKYQQENDFFAAINVRVNKNTESVFAVPTIKQKIIPQPKAQEGKEFSLEPMMGNKMYEDILKVIYDSGKNMEKKPVLYVGKDEEGLRDQFLFVLETRYEGTTATGETFNRSGKTDIILKYSRDGSNVFVAECKFWHGASEYIKAVSQLFDRYLTWRDSKVAVIMFVKNNDFTNVLATIRKETLNHPYAIKEVGIRGESSFSYLFHLPQDKHKVVHLEVMAFHYDKK